jgi:hypothetical protein
MSLPVVMPVVLPVFVVRAGGVVVLLLAHRASSFRRDGKGNAGGARFPLCAHARTQALINCTPYAAAKAGRSVPALRRGPSGPLPGAGW